MCYMKMVMLGAPGSGKGTQAEFLSKKLGIPTISTGAIVRNAIADETELGMESKKYIDEGKLLPDTLINDILVERLGDEDCKDGFILDGYPRNATQAEYLDKTDFTIDVALFIEVEDDEVIERLSNRLQCESCGSSYHLEYKLPVKEGICDNCGKKLIRRSDDTPEIIRKRLDVYHGLSEPLKNYYINKNNIVIVTSQKKVSDTYKLVCEALELSYP